MNEIYWGNRKPLEWGDPGEGFKREEEKKMSSAIELIEKSGQFEKNDYKQLLEDYQLLMRGHKINVGGVGYSGILRDDCKSPMGFITDYGAKDVLKASKVLDKALELIK